MTDGTMAAAERHLLQALRLDPRHAQTYNQLGSLYYRQGRIPEALSYLSKALRLDPACWKAHYNTAHCYAQQNNMEQAAQHYAAVVARQPSLSHAQFNLGLCYVALEDFVQAEQPLLIAFKQDPDLVEAARQLGHISIALGKTEQAIEMFQQVLEQSQTPHQAEAHHNLAVLYLGSKNPEAALKHFEAALQQNPDNQTAQHLCAALKGEAAPCTAPLLYVEQLFDQYAPYYNEHLKQTLHYTLPSQLRNAVARCLTGNLKAGRVLDLGCGTGLCGIVFRDLALELVGIDLSAKMIAQATRLDTYEKLIQGDYQPYLADPSLQSFDIIVACDVLVYRGDLQDLFETLPNALAPGGLFVFSLETTTEVDSYQLRSSGRFAHAIAYIEKFANAHNLSIVLEEEAILRSDQQRSITGRLIVLKKAMITS
ncbi:MAG: tetratricopeptide repeat protein [Gammaproteobacteria bacterium]|nr:tetratricopeptide repeat protein [Gammaproteobacteria bacterium]MBP9728980.1 tetratricopeptide repeat protein [Gammaproteobacteria bacterium]